MLRLLGSLLWKCSVRHWRRSLKSYLVLVGIIAVGVGAFNGIRQASRAATSNFGLFNEAISGRSDFIIEGRGGAFDGQVLKRMGRQIRTPDLHLLPVVEGTGVWMGEEGRPEQRLRLVGLDLVSIGNVPAFLEAGYRLGEEGSHWTDWVGREGCIWITDTLQGRFGLEKGDSLEIVLAGKLERLEVVGILGEGGRSGLPDDLLIGDLPVVQSLLGRGAAIDRVEVLVVDPETRADPGELEKVEGFLRERVPGELVILPVAERMASRAAMTEAFRLNLLILSLIAMLVGAYLVLQALDTAVVRRRSEIGILKSLGTPNRVIFSLWLIEASLLGLVGSLAGILVGWGLAQGAVHLVAGTVNTLYFTTSVESARLIGLDVALGLVLGIGFSVVAGILPARDAVSTPAAQVLARGDWSPGFSLLARPWPGLMMILLGVVCLLIPPPRLDSGGRLALGGFLTAGAWIFGLAWLTGGLLHPLGKMLKRVRGGPMYRIACSRLGEGGSRHRLAVAGIVVAVGMVTGMFQLVGSFRITINEWFDVRFQADLFLSERSAGGGVGAVGIVPEVVNAVEGDRAVKASDTWYETRVEGEIGPTSLAGANFELWEGEIKQIWIRPPEGIPMYQEVDTLAYVSEAFARRNGVLEGGVVQLETPSGLKRIGVKGVYAEYGNEFGTAVIEASVWRNWMGRGHAKTMSLFLEDGQDVNEVRDRLRVEFEGLEIRNEEELRVRALEIFEETFRVTTALNVIGLTVAFLGLFLGLSSIFRESKETWETLRKLGTSEGGMLALAAWEGAGIGLVGWMGGTVLGLLLGWLLVAVINVQSFGWTLMQYVPIGGILGFGVILVLIGGLSGVVARRWEK
ncbi:MAG: FtsX-like permease family protein [Puniceicoccaceae bacterium]